MKLFSVLSLVFVGILPAASGTAVAPGPASNRAPAAARQLPMRFDHVLLGNVARILSARYGVTVSIAANSKAPISGDFSSYDLKSSIAECARQAGLAVVPLGAKLSDGFSLELPKQPAAVKIADGNDVTSADQKAAVQAALAEAAARRAKLLLQRNALVEQESALQSPASDDYSASR